MDTTPERSRATPPQPLGLAFLPVDKRAFGVAVGVATGLAVALATALVLVRGADGVNLWLLRAYFAGYSVSWTGVLVGFVWAFVVGFTAGWFVAFCRNLVLAVSIFVVRTRAEIFETRDFLDHI
ncbi:MAG: hypothetical protein AB7R55_19765 [Gemmatimonadales bacterium]